MNADRRVFVVLSLYKPDPVLLFRQLESLFLQSYRNFIIVACCDGHLDVEGEDVIRKFADLPVHVVRFESRAGVHANFARGLRAAVAASQGVTDLFAFCDQDDVWHPKKLEREVASFSDPQTSLVHCDARVVSEQGRVLAQSLFKHEARSPGTSFAHLLIMNSVTGMTSVFRRDVAETAQDFPLSGCRYILHDHWVALVASLLGSVRFINEPLVDYTQHGGNVRGARRWQGRLSRAATPSRRRNYLLKCYRQFLWRRRALEILRQKLADTPRCKGKLLGNSLRVLFNCESRKAEGLALSLAYRMRGRRRQADQVWRIWRGRLLYCGSPSAKRKDLSRPST